MRYELAPAKPSVADHRDYRLTRWNGTYAFRPMPATEVVKYLTFSGATKAAKIYGGVVVPAS